MLPPPKGTRAARSRRLKAMAKAGCNLEVHRTCAGQTSELQFVLKTCGSVTVELLRMPALDLQIAIRARC
jgi:hypothetical protein